MVCRFRVVPCIGLIISLAFGSLIGAAETDGWIGRQFMPRETCTPKVRDREISLKLLSLPFTVQRVNGEWLWIGRAWVKKRDVIPLNEAGAYYSGYLQQNPQSSWAYACRGAVCSRKGELEAARRDIAAAISLDPANVTADAANVVETFAVARNGDLLLVPVTIGGHEYPFVVDTGSSWCVVDSTLRSHLTPTKRTVIVNGTEEFDVYEMRDSYIGKSRLRMTGTTVCSDLAELRKWTGLDIRGLVGMSVLKAHVLHIDFDSGILAILKHGPDSKEGAIDISYRWGVPTIDITLPNDELARFDVDSGMMTGSKFDDCTFSKLAKSGFVGVVDYSTEYLSIHGREHGCNALIGQLSIAQFEHGSHECHDGRSNALGLEVLSQYVLTIDFPNNRLHLQTGKRFGEPPRFDMSGLALSRIAAKTVIKWVNKNSPAETAGVRDGDQLLCLDGIRSDEISLFELGRRLSEESRHVRLVVCRNGERRTIEFRLADWQNMSAMLQLFAGGEYSRVIPLSRDQSADDSMQGDDTPAKWQRRKRNQPRLNAKIALERSVRIHVHSDAILIGPNDVAIRFDEDAAMDETVDQIKATIERIVDEWGDPPQSYYWLPTLRYVIHPEGNKLYERLHGPVEQRCGVTSKSAIAREDRTSKPTAEADSRVAQ